MRTPERSGGGAHSWAAYFKLYRCAYSSQAQTRALLNTAARMDDGGAAIPQIGWWPVFGVCFGWSRVAGNSELGLSNCRITRIEYSNIELRNAGTFVLLKARHNDTHLGNTGAFVMVESQNS